MMRCCAPLTGWFKCRSAMPNKVQSEPKANDARRKRNPSWCLCLDCETTRLMKRCAGLAFPLLVASALASASTPPKGHQQQRQQKAEREFVTACQEAFDRSSRENGNEEGMPAGKKICECTAK